MHPDKERLIRQRLFISFALAIVALVGAEALNRPVPLPDHGARLRAATLVREAEGVLRAEKLRRSVPIDPQADAGGTGVIGPPSSPIVTDSSAITVKRAAANPNLAAGVVGMLGELGVGPGDPVALCMTGSMPGANLAVLAAVRALGAKPTIINSVGPSMYGATDPAFTWLDMAKVLADRKLLDAVPIAATPGGRGDSARGLPEETRRLMAEAARRNGVPFRIPASLPEAVSFREALFQKSQGGRPKVFINVGGGAASYGSQLNSIVAPEPVIRPEQAEQLEPFGLIHRMLRNGVPVINIHHLTPIVASLGLPSDVSAPVPVGEPQSLYCAERRPLLPLAAICLGLVLALALLLRVGGVVPGHDAFAVPPPSTVEAPVPYPEEEERTRCDSEQ